MSSSRATRAKSATAALANKMANESVGRLGPNYSVLAGMKPRKSVKASRLPRAVVNAIRATRGKYGNPPKTRKMRAQNYPRLQEMRRAAAANLSRRMGAAARNAHENVNFNAAIREEERKLMKEGRGKRAVLARLERNLAKGKKRMMRENFAGRPKNVEPNNARVNALAAMFGKRL
jgi:hypothetical protein